MGDEELEMVANKKGSHIERSCWKVLFHFLLLTRDVMGTWIKKLLLLLLLRRILKDLKRFLLMMRSSINGVSYGMDHL